MPELPEVETIVRDLEKKLKNKRVKEVEVKDAKAINIKPPEFNRLLAGRAVKSVKRRAKMIIIELSRDFLVIHLKMTGQLVLKTDHQLIAGGHPIAGVGKQLPNKFSRVIFLFNDRSRLYFNDVRRFGWIKLVSHNELAEISDNLGIEPLSSDFSLEIFKQILSRKSRTAIKQAIMDQAFLAGIGNIYADEALFLSGIKPVRKVSTLKPEEIKKLWLAIPKVLKYSIKHRGTSFNDYVDARGEVGNFIKYLKVYGRAGEKCRQCGQPIKKIKLGGRGTHWCGRCQK